MKKIVLAVLGAMLVLASPAAAAEPALNWSAPQTVAPDVITDVDCPTTGLCIAVDVGGNVITTTDPAGPAAGWVAANVSGERLNSVSCASAGLCAAAGRAGNLFTSTNPTGGAAAWTATKVAGTGDLKAVDCAAGICAALDAQSRIILSSNPTGGPGAWYVAEPPSSFSLAAVDCPDSGLCVAVGHAPRSEGGGLTVQKNLVVTVSEPAKPAMTFKNTYPGFRTFLQAVSCPTAGFCLAVGQEGYGWSSSDPRGGEAAWSEVSIAEEALVDVSCPAASFCAVLGDSGRALTSTNPVGGSVEWGSREIDPEIESLSCPSASLCLAAGERGAIVGTPVATGGKGGVQPPPVWTPPAWTPTPIPAGKLGLARASRLAVESGRVKVPVSCTGASGCHGVVSFRAGKLKIGSSSGFLVHVGTTKLVPVRLNKNGRKLFEDKSKVWAQAILDSRGTSKTPNQRKSLLLEWKR